MIRWLGFVALGAIALTPAIANENGDLWEVTSQMTVEGMPAGMGMPAQTRRVCTAREWTKPPVAQDEHGCKTTDFQTTATKTTWKMTCPDVSGEGEITRTSPDAYTGWIKMSMAQGAMKMTLTGKRVGDCDAGEAKKEREAQIAHVQTQLAAGEKAVADAKEQQCMSVAQSGDLKTFNEQVGFGMCTDPKYKAAFCENAKKCDVFKRLAEMEKSKPDAGLTAVATFCGADVAAMLRHCCEEAVKTDDLDFVAAKCPDQARPLALEKCAGMNYTALMGSKWLSFCTTYARETMEKGGAAPAKKR